MHETPHKLPSAHETHFPFRRVINFFFTKKKKLQKEVGEPAARPLLRPSIVPPQATFPQICGALSDFSAPRNHKILKLCSRKGSVNLTVAWCEPALYHAHCAPRAVWAQTGLVRGRRLAPRGGDQENPHGMSLFFLVSSVSLGSMGVVSAGAVSRAVVSASVVCAGSVTGSDSVVCSDSVLSSGG